MTPTIDFNTLGLQCMPPKLRKPFWAGFIRVLVRPLVWLYDDYIAYTAETRRRRAYNGQSYRLELLLNTDFGTGTYTIGAPPTAAGREIWILTVADALPFQYLYTVPEAQPNYLYLAAEGFPRTIYLYAEYLAQYEFIIYIPAAMWTGLGADGQQRFRANVDAYRLAGMRYKIQTY